jgi:ethanolamine utilization protein EutA
MSDLDDDEQEIGGLAEEDRAAIAHFIWSQDNLELRTIGIDIGSSTSHLLYAKVALRRQAEGLSSRFVVINREVLWRSPIMLTPFLSDGTIDAKALDRFIHESYAAAGIARSEVDSGAVILTGEAVKRKNARAIDELFAQEAGKFVCATAGHKLECTLAAHGSGAVALSRRLRECVLHVDIGGGTTKLALIDKGRIVAVAAFAVGGRLIARDETGHWTRIDDSARLVAQELGIAPTPESFADGKARHAIAARLAALAVDEIVGAALDRLGRALLLTEPLARSVAPARITFSGGVSEYIFAREEAEFGDIAKLLASELLAKLGERSDLPVSDPGNRIRATVIGASQFTVQVSGKTIYLPDQNVLPVHNVPVLQLGLDLAGDIDGAAVGAAIVAKLSQLDLEPQARVAVAFTFAGDPEHHRIKSLAHAIMRPLAPAGVREEPLLLMIDGDIGKTIGQLMHRELGLVGPVVSIDGVQLQDLDFVDIGELISPPGVVPVVIKSLLFA